jgi:predicted RNase H-like HicB family nuclease
MEQYTVTIFWSAEDEAYIAIVDELEGCSAWGETREEALKEVKTAMELWLQTAREHGDPIPEAKKYKDVA